ncbi:hypothetical protein MRX96_057278 [Rhipicephalus microplus]
MALSEPPATRAPRQCHRHETHYFLRSYSWNYGRSGRRCGVAPTCESDGTIIRVFRAGDPTRVISSAINVLARPQPLPAACGHRVMSSWTPQTPVNDAATMREQLQRSAQACSTGTEFAMYGRF